MQMLTNYLHN